MGKPAYLLSSSLAAVYLLITGGCGAADVFPDAGVPLAQLSEESACPYAPAPAEADTLVVIDWDGGYSTQIASRRLAGFNTDMLTFDDAVAYADANAGFRQAVLARTQEILCALDPMDIAVIAGDSDDFPGATIVHITGDEPTTSAKHIGQAHFDPCNEHPDDGVVIWGGALAGRIDAATHEQWVNAFANTVAHEVGHTLGFAHPDEDELARAIPQPSAEVMRGKVTIDALLSEQYFLLEQDTCPGETASVSYGLVIDDS